MATDLNNLAGLLRATNRLAEAEPMYRRALAIDENSYGSDHPDVARDLNNLAGLLRATNRLAEAEPMYRRALAIDEKSYGPDHPNVAVRLNNLAGLLEATNRLAEAEPMYRRVVSIFEKSLGPDHPNVATALNNLAGLLRATNRLAEAEPMYRRVVSIFEKSLGPDHPNVATALNNLAQLLQDMNRLAEAEPLMRRALAIDEKSYGPDHPEVAADLNNLAELLRATNRLAEAEPMYRRAVEILIEFNRATGHPHPHLQDAVNNYKSLLRAMGRSEEQILATLREMAPELFEQAGQESSDGGTQSFDLSNADDLRGLNNVAFEMRMQGQVSECEPIDRAVAEATEKLLGGTHPLTLHRRNNLVLDVILLGRLAEARELLRESWQTRAEAFANTTPRVAFLGYIVALLEARLDTPFLGQLKTLLIGPELPVAAEVAVPWDIAYFIDRLSVASGSAGFLRALVAAMNDRIGVAALDGFPEWRDQEPITLDAAWPEG